MNQSNNQPRFMFVQSRLTTGVKHCFTGSIFLVGVGVLKNMQIEAVLRKEKVQLYLLSLDKIVQHLVQHIDLGPVVGSC